MSHQIMELSTWVRSVPAHPDQADLQRTRTQWLKATGLWYKSSSRRWQGTRGPRVRSRSRTMPPILLPSLAAAGLRTNRRNIRKFKIKRWGKWTPVENQPNTTQLRIPSINGKKPEQSFNKMRPYPYLPLVVVKKVIRVWSISRPALTANLYSSVWKTTTS